NTGRSCLTIALSLGLTWTFLVVFDLYKSRVSSVRSAELAALARVVVIVLPATLLIDLLVTDELHLGTDLMAGAALLVLLVTGRSIFDGWIRNARSQGRYTRSVVVVGAGPGAKDLMDMLSNHQEAGYRVKGVVATRGDDVGVGDWLGEPVDVLQAMATVGANGAFVVVDELTPADRSFVIEKLASVGHHVHLTMGIAGIASQRVRLAPIVHEPLLYVDSPRLQQWQLYTKRALDVAMASVALVLAAPFMLLAALLIRLQDGGPVLFSQNRVGLGGRHFRLWKLRTMQVGAESRLDEVRDQNGRLGPLLKVEHDPRVTRIGHVLRFTSIDEVPQLFNVIRGDMSLVGPRPALPHEVEAFDDELLARHNVLPGITGLWQVEARDNPSFASYRRLDLFYVKNWSISLDVMILVLTVQSVLGRAFRGLLARGEATEAC
ncbi:MAG: sugar transferase, partial [Acidimicrobiales bacterium]